jgi:hypothetical protein
LAMAQSDDPAHAAKAKLEAIRADALWALDRNDTLPRKSRLPSWATDIFTVIANTAESALLDVEQFIVRPQPPQAASCTITAAGLTTTNVQNAIDDASVTHGSVVCLPAGTQTWSTTVTITEGITLRGAGVGSTIIRDGHSGGTVLIDVTLASGQTTRITGIEFNDNGRAGSPYVIIFTGEADSRRFRFDHNELDNMNGFAILSKGAWGLIDHNTITYSTNNIPIYFTSNGTYTYPDARWAASAGWGSADFLFIEDNTITASAGPAACIDGYGGARYVFRYNTVTRCYVEAHGTESAGRFRGTRAIEVYSNTFTGDDSFSHLVDLRSGTALVYNNTATGYTGSPGAVHPVNDRLAFFFTPWGIADGTNGWDKNDAGNPIASHSATSGTGLTVTVSGAGWSTNQWAGYSIKKTNSCTSSAVLTCAALIVSNTATVITFESSFGFGDNLDFTASDTFNINLVTEVLDQPGRSGGEDLTGDDPVSVPGGWAQVDDPIYMWSNTEDGGSIGVNIGPFGGQVRLNEHYFLSAAPGYTAYTYPHPLVTP